MQTITYVATLALGVALIAKGQLSMGALVAASMLSGVFPALFPADLMAKDFGNLLATAGAVAASMPVAAAVYDVFAGAVRHGLGADNLTGIIRLYR